MTRKVAPSKEQTTLLPAFECLGLEQILVPNTATQFEAAAADISRAGIVGFDTESKPTFLKDEVSEGPHIVQFATTQKAYIFQLHHEDCRHFLADLLCSSAVLKVGFGLESDHEQIQHKLGLRLAAVLDLNTIFRKEGYANSTGARAAVAIMFQQKFHKSKKVTTSNWAERQLTPRQLLYAANDAYVALRVHAALNDRALP
ncbi:3'-5' exonuclease [Roseateles oligotrophus]|uniref:3'-5' exonuclease domain-containing protein 2 n=1 Tax=Roseateles oligotrophus TaxID=1769250 RepID=A0ABT2Y9Y4_9BURK|nr:3'-5' exonuclease [Roseateles oligotrophus]MCV2366859.1 3'-5' exonuclease domain-containing protein 2 [Roseateles oligotrophus]